MNENDKRQLSQLVHIQEDRHPNELGLTASQEREKFGRFVKNLFDQLDARIARQIGLPVVLEQKTSNLAHRAADC